MNYQLQNGLHQLTIGKKWQKPQTKAETKSAILPDVICGIIPETNIKRAA
ncbi:hypothetical protein JYQ62_20585 [Nostoc sp. UHCC 0702]|nr:hypothetical protein JYQ62_20585 [Nostoc sp. UHCC 0702]